MLAAGCVAAGASAPAALACAEHSPFSFWDQTMQALAAGRQATAEASPPAASPAAPPAAPAPAAQPKPKVVEAPVQQRPPRLRWITGSRYERTTDVTTLRRQGCAAGTRRQNGLVVLAFGKPAYNGSSYGTILFSNRFASNRQITGALKAYANGYAACLPKDSPALITLGRGTSNYHPSTPSAYRAGRRWARETIAFARYLRRHPSVGAHVRAAAAIDAEPAWDRSFHRTRDFFRGFRDARTGYLLYNFGSLDGGVGSIWTLRQAFFVSGGMKYARMVPEIYYRTQARQWAHLARLARKTYGRSVRFAGVMTQHSAGCGCGMTPLQAHRALRRELAQHSATRPLVRSLASVTNIRWSS